jgi:D-sedoheptulose 7-phosphate isomerase
MTGYSNDLNYEAVFVEQFKNLLQPGNLVVGSGGSPNVLRAMAYARNQGARTIGLTGSQPSAKRLEESCDLCVQALLRQNEQIEDLHSSCITS